MNLYRVSRSPAGLRAPLRRILFAAQEILGTGWLMPFALLGILMLALARRSRELVWLLAVPLYFILAGSLMHMEHRYIMVIYYLLPILAVLPIYFLAGLIGGLGLSMRKAFKRGHGA